MKYFIKYILGVCCIPAALLGFSCSMFICSFKAGQTYVNDLARWIR